jgi:transposase InsO family protein
VVATLDRLCRATGYPKTIRVDQSSEFVSRDMDLWAFQRDVVLDFSRPGKPTDNAFMEAFNGRFRAECLNQHWFLNLADAAESWRLGVDTTTRNGHRPVQTDQVKEALDKPGGLAKRHAEQHLHRQAGLDRGTLLSGWRPRWPVGAACQVIPGSNQIVSEPRPFSALL